MRNILRKLTKAVFSFLFFFWGGGVEEGGKEGLEDDQHNQKCKPNSALIR